MKKKRFFLRNKMNAEDKTRTYYILLGSFIVIILILTIALGIVLFQTNSNIIQTNVVEKETIVRIEEFEKIQAANNAVTKSNLNSINSTLNTITKDLNNLTTCCSTVRNNTGKILQDVTSIPKPPSIDILNKPIPIDTGVSADTPLNAFDSESLALPVDYSKVNFMYVLRSHHCKNKKSLSGTKLERITIPELKNEVILSFTPHQKGFLISTDKNRIHYIIPGSYTNRYNIRWSESVPYTIHDMIRLSNGNDLLYYGVSDGNLLAMNISDSKPINKIEFQNVPMDNEVMNISISPDTSLMAISDTSNQTSVYKFTSNNGVQKVTDLPYTTYSISDAKNGSFDIIANIDGALQIVGTTKIPLPDFTKASFINSNYNVFGINNQHSRYIDHFKVHDDDIYFVSKTNNSNPEIIL